LLPRVAQGGGSSATPWHHHAIIRRRELLRCAGEPQADDALHGGMEQFREPKCTRTCGVLFLGQDNRLAH
jgi:hypothetical protein